MDDYDLWFSLLRINIVDKNELLKNFKSTKEIWYYYVNNENLIKNSYNNDQIRYIKDKILINEISTVTIYDEYYPTELKNYPDAPFLLYYKGDLKKINKIKNVAIVGARKCTYYGENVTSIIAKSLSTNNIGIVSGAARGIDSLAHKECIEKHSYTCGVLGNGLDIVYPKENKYIYEYCVNNGCIISEFPPGTPPLKINFPYRNRIISGISDLVIVVEAGVKSGALITASYAAEQGKRVLVVPGSVFSKMSAGTNSLIRDGADIFTSMHDIELALNTKLLYNTKNDKSNIINSKERKIYDIIKDKPVHIDDIIRITNIDIKTVYELLFEMQFKNKISCLSGNYYVRVNNRI